MYKGTTRNPVTVILLTIITCGIYGVYWMYTAGKEINAALGRNAVDPAYAIIGFFCFPFYLYYAYKLDKSLKEYCDTYGISYSENFILWLILTLLFDFGLFVMEIQVQSTLNDAWEKV